jgi:hypothetical protein
VGAGDGHGVGIILHDAAEEYGALKGGDALLPGGGQLTVVGADGGGIDDDPGPFDIFSFVADNDGYADGSQVFYLFAVLDIAAGNFITPVFQDLGQSAHADAADPDKMNPPIFLEQSSQLVDWQNADISLFRYYFYYMAKTAKYKQLFLAYKKRNRIL